MRPRPVPIDTNVPKNPRSMFRTRNILRPTLRNYEKRINPLQGTSEKVDAKLF